MNSNYKGQTSRETYCKIRHGHHDKCFLLLLPLFLFLSFFLCVGPGIERSKIYFTILWLFRQYFQSFLTNAASGTRRTVSGASLLQERFLQVESSKRSFVKVSLG